MALDTTAARTVASLLALAWVGGCGPSVHPVGPGVMEADLDTAEPQVLAPANAFAAGYGQNLVVAEMCPTMGLGKPGLVPLMTHGVDWQAEPERLTDLIERVAVTRYVVLASDGTPAGSFDASEPVDSDLPQAVTAGVYVGHDPCSTVAGAGRVVDPACARIAKGCGLAIGETDQVEGVAPTLLPSRMGGACMNGTDLVVDIDGDGEPEQFRLASFVDEEGGPGSEIVAVPVTGACVANFSVYGLSVVPKDPKSIVAIDVMGVLDLDDDGRRDLVLSFHYPSGRAVVIYSAQDSVSTLTRVAEAAAWQ